MAQEHDHSQMMSPFYGKYSHTRESSGTAWQPDSTPMEGWHFNYEDWSMMTHATVTGIYNDQGGKRGDDKFYSTNMAMLMGTHSWDSSTVGFRSMLSLEPFMGKNGYPELLQSGETADGEEHLIDRQHPHDLFMEMALTYSYALTENSSAFFYAALPGEPAIGPAVFMHRESGMDIPDAPITHHWLDSTHVTFGVLTLGYIFENLKLEASIFNGREPDENRYDIEVRPLTSQSYRITYNPTSNWSSQVSYAYLDSSEQLEPDVNQDRLTASISYNLPFEEGNWASTFAWGKDINDPGHNLNAFLIESDLKLQEIHTIFSRFENVQKDELFPEESPQAGNIYRVNKVVAGYIYDFPKIAEHFTLGLGGEASFAIIPDSLHEAYGEDPFSYLIFVRGKIV